MHPIETKSGGIKMIVIFWSFIILSVGCIVADYIFPKIGL